MPTLDDLRNVFPHNITYSMANRLLESYDGDVVISCLPGADGRTNLYAHTTVLKARCNYYAKSTPA